MSATITARTRVKVVNFYGCVLFAWYWGYRLRAVTIGSIIGVIVLMMAFIIGIV
jgi:hypothetical protein